MKKQFQLVMSIILSMAAAKDVIAQSCETYDVKFEKGFYETLRSMPATVVAVEVSGEKAVYVSDSLEGLKDKKLLPEGMPLKEGQFVETGTKSELKLIFFIPTEHSFTISENSKIKIVKNPNQQCGVIIEAIKGKITATSKARDKLNSEQKTTDVLKNVRACSIEGEIQTENVTVRPVGTKYSVDLSESISQSDGDVTKVETYDVEEGKVLVRPKKSKEKFAIKIKKVKKGKKTKTRKEDRRDEELSEEEFDRRLSQFILDADKRSSKKARLKRNRKSKEASVEIIPVD